MAGGKGRTSLAASLKHKDKDIRKWAQAMIDACKGIDEVPTGWLSQDELARSLKMATASVGPHLRKLEELGRVEKKKFCVTRAKDGRVIPKYFYKLK